ncbi:MAG: aminotransferase class V-fold PLP-dependent enzyme, partial [Caldilineaceae bacterium]|nr:aminotransferase class V-fold PLP-dependent enzyme [Caldilineaceae bacterium]
MGRRNWQVFEDFLEIAERNLWDQPMHVEHVAAGMPLPESAEAIALVAGLERHYPGDEHWDNFAQAYALLLDAAETAEAVGGSWDTLGEVFMEFGQPSHWYGQHFTTWNTAMLAQRLLNGNDEARIAEALAADAGHAIRAVLVTHVDTASSALSDIAAIRAAIDSTGHPALLAVDAIASLACDEMRMDEWGVDILVGASQKGLMLPP